MTSKTDSLFNDVISTSGVNTQSNEMGSQLQMLRRDGRCSIHGQF